jgi:hypothetical protein
MNRYDKTQLSGFFASVASVPPRGIAFPLPPWGIPARVFPGEPAVALLYGYTPQRAGPRHQT